MTDQFFVILSGGDGGGEPVTSPTQAKYGLTAMSLSLGEDVT